VVCDFLLPQCLKPGSFAMDDGGLIDVTKIRSCRLLAVSLINQGGVFFVVKTGGVASG
jgi:hypothetical protein